MADIDYKALLAKYLDHVADCEGAFFLDHLTAYDTFTAREYATLMDVVQELEEGKFHD